MTAAEKLEQLIKTDFDRFFADKMREFVADLDYVDKDVFVLGAFFDCPTPEKKQKMLDYIKKYNITSDQDFMALGTCIADGVEPELKTSDDD